jgi:hypothetical protein
MTAVRTHTGTLFMEDSPVVYPKTVEIISTSSAGAKNRIDDKELPANCPNEDAPVQGWWDE